MKDSPWLAYWYGTSLIAIDHGAARAHLERSFGGFEMLEERRWQCLAAAGVIDTHFFEWSDFRPVRRWAAVLGELIHAVPMFERKQAELKVYSSWLLAMVYGEPGHPECERCADHVEQMLDQEIDIDSKMTAAVFLLSFSTLAAQLERGRRVVARFGQLVADPQVSALNQRWWWTRLGYFLWHTADNEGAWQALVRLRKLLGSHDALVVADEQVSLNEALVWVDARAFERLTAQADAQILEAQPARPQHLLEQVLNLYQGNFLTSEGEEAWALKYRLRLRGMLARVIENIGAQLEELGEWDHARACYQRGIEADDLVEEFYLGLMRCYRALERPAEGIAVFRRLRQTLSVVLGVAPSPSAETLLKALRESGAARPA